jgi:2-aminoadipate transaminase
VDVAIDRLQRVSARRTGLIGLAGGLPDASLFPRTALHAAFARALSGSDEGGSCLQYDWPEGSQPLRRWIAARLAARGADVSEGDVIVTSGAQQALAIATSQLARPGDAVDVDERAYPAALDLFRGRELRLVSSSEARWCAPRFSYVMPGVANPTGVGLSPERIVDLLAGTHAIVADEAYAELRFDGALPPLLLASARDRTWHVGTFSKTLCPGLRVGFLVPPRSHRAAALAAKQDADLQAGTLAQSILAHFLSVDDFDARLERIRKIYADRAGQLVRALRQTFPSFRVHEPEGGFSVWVETDAPGDDVALLHAAIKHGVSFDPGRVFHRSPEPGALSLRLCHSSAPITDLAEGVARLAKAFASGARSSA